MALPKKNENAGNSDIALYPALCDLCPKDAGAMPTAEIMVRRSALGLPSSGHAASRRNGDQRLQAPARTGVASRRKEIMVRRSALGLPSSGHAASRRNGDQRLQAPARTGVASRRKKHIATIPENSEGDLWVKDRAPMRFLQSLKAVPSRT